MGLFSILKDKTKGSGSQLVTTPSDSIAPSLNSQIDRRTIFRNRQNFGVNFGSVFVQEKYIFEKFFINNTSNELDAITEYINAHGLDKTKQDLEGHWSNYLTSDDWKWLKDKGVTAIRLPIGYWHVGGGGKFTDGTPFARIAAAYANSWSAIQNYFSKANEYDIGILIDLHALPGGANTADHSGAPLSSAEFWKNSEYQALTIELLQFIVHECQNYENFVGLQIVNESEFSDDGSKQKSYYSNAISAIREIDQNLPIIISDGWWPDQWVKWLAQSEANMKAHSGVIIDTHIYRCFDESDKNKSPEQIINELDSTVLTNLSGSADFMIGEYSCVLDGKSWEKTSADRSSLVNQFGQTQTALFIERANFGHFFWTFKFQWGDGGEWGFVPQLNSGSLLSQPTNLKQKPDDQLRDDHLNDALNSHKSYWDSQNPHESYEHWRFEDGFRTGWNDCVSFANFNGSKLGRITAWKSSRRQEHINLKGESRFMWEWEQGFDQGSQNCKNVLFFN